MDPTFPPLYQMHTTAPCAVEADAMTITVAHSAQRPTSDSVVSVSSGQRLEAPETRSPDRVIESKPPEEGKDEDVEEEEEDAGEYNDAEDGEDEDDECMSYCSNPDCCDPALQYHSEDTVAYMRHRGLCLDSEGYWYDPGSCLLMCSRPKGVVFDDGDLC